MTSRFLREYSIPENLPYSVRWKGIVTADSAWEALQDIPFLLALNIQLGMNHPNFFSESERIMSAPLKSDKLQFLLHAASRSFLVATDDELRSMPGLKDSDLQLIDAALESIRQQRE